MQQPVHVIGTNFKFRASIKRYVSMIFISSWHGVGSFDFIVHRDTYGVKEIEKDVLIALSPDKVGIVKHREIQLDENGKATENWLFKGYTLEGLLISRMTIPPSHTAYDHRSSNAETVMKHYVNNNAVNPVDVKRKIAELQLEENLNRGKSTTWQSRFKNLDEELEKISQFSGLGWSIKLDVENEHFVFVVNEGVDRSVNQTERSHVFFSPEFGNIKGQSFSDSDFGYKNVGYVAGQGEGVDRLVVELGEATGLDRHEVFIDARDLGGESEEGTELTVEEERALLTERGQQKLDEMSNELYFEAQIMTPVLRTSFKEEFETFLFPFQPVYKRTQETQLHGTFVYGKDYFLGDIVTVMNREWGVMVDRRITEIKEIHEPGGFALEATFGQSKPTLISKLKGKFSEYDSELMR